MSKRRTGDERETDPGKRPEGGGEERAGRPRRSAAAETDRLTNMAAGLSAGVSIVPIPGTSAALTGMELLLIGAIARIWGHNLTDGYMAGLMRSLVARFGVAMGMHAVGDMVGMIPGFGMLAKPAIQAGVVKFVGTSLREQFAKEHGKDVAAAVTAEEAKESLEKAVARLAAYAPDLTKGAKQAFQGDGKLLARTLNRIFGLEE